METKSFAEQLCDINACQEAIDWVGDRDAETAWRECERGDWMLWLAGRVADRKRVVLAACECARLTLEYVPDGEVRPLKAIEAAEAWAKGDASVSIGDVRAAARAAAYAAAYAAADVAADVADAADAEYAECAASAAARAACAAAYAAACAYAAADAAACADAAARRATLADCANIVRKHFPVCPKLDD